MLNTININLKTDIKTESPTSLPIRLMSQDKNNNQFILRFTNDGEQVTLDNTYTVEVLTKFVKSGTSRLTLAIVRRGYVTWEFDTDYITQNETVYNYVYVRKSGNLVVSADSNAFYFKVGLSEIDKDAGRVAETYDENYQKYLDSFKDNVDLVKIAQAETERVSNEEERISNESERVQSEDERENAEEQRKTDHANRSAELAGKADKVVLENLIKNGNFESASPTPINGTISDGILDFTGTSTSSGFSHRTPSILGHKYYIQFKVRYTGDKPSFAGFSLTGFGHDFYYTHRLGEPNSWVTLSDIIESNRSTINSAYNFITGTAQYDDFILIDLTKTFGAGNEPTKEEMDELIKVTGYIDEEYALNNKEMLRYLMNIKANKKQEAWISPTLLNGATGTVQYRKNEMGRVEFRGNLRSNSGSSLFILPDGYRPREDCVFIAPISNQLKDTIRRFKIISIGSFYGGLAYGDFEFSLSGVSFPVD